MLRPRYLTNAFSLIILLAASVSYGFKRITNLPSLGFCFAAENRSLGHYVPEYGVYDKQCVDMQNRKYGGRPYMSKGDRLEVFELTEFNTALVQWISPPNDTGKRLVVVGYALLIDLKDCTGEAAKRKQAPPPSPVPVATKPPVERPVEIQTSFDFEHPTTTKNPRDFDNTNSPIRWCPTTSTRVGAVDSTDFQPKDVNYFAIDPNKEFANDLNAEVMMCIAEAGCVDIRGKGSVPMGTIIKARNFWGITTEGYAMLNPPEMNGGEGGCFMSGQWLPAKDYKSKFKKYFPKKYGYTSFFPDWKGCDACAEFGVIRSRASSMSSGVDVVNKAKAFELCRVIEYTFTNGNTKGKNWQVECYFDPNDFRFFTQGCPKSGSVYTCYN